MRPSKTVLGFIAAVLLSVQLCACGKNVDDNVAPHVMLEIQLSISKEDLANGKVRVNALMLNTTKQDINFLPWNTPFGKELNGRVFTIKSDNNGELSYAGIMVKRLPPTELDYLDVSSERSLTRSLDITKSYKFCSNSSYALSFEGVIVSRDGDFLTFTSAPVSFTTGSHFANCSQSRNYN